MRKVRSIKILLGGFGVALFILIGLTPAGASSANISHSYSTSASIINGSLVSLDPLHSNFVVPANSGNGQQLLGVAVAINDSLLAVDPSNNSGVVQVATSGQANTLVSDVNGDINVGDQISVSPFNGVGMKASPGSHVIGLAQTAFSRASTATTAENVTDKSGKSTQVLVGYVKLGIAIGTASTQGSDQQLNQLQKAAKAISGHDVSTARAFISLLIAVVAIVALITLIYASIYGGVISIGRNPLAKYAVFRSLGSVMVMVILMASIAGTTIFFLLR